MCCVGMLAVQQFLYHQLGVANAAGQLLTAAELLQQRQLIGAEVPLLVDVGHSSHQRAQDQLGVVLEDGERKFRVCTRGIMRQEQTNMQSIATVKTVPGIHSHPKY